MRGGHKGDGQRTSGAGVGSDVTGGQWQTGHRGGSRHRLRR